MVDFSVYNPSINAFAAVQVATLFQRDGAVKTSVSILSFPLFTNRFQPSIAFEVVLAGVIVILVRPCEPRPPTRRGAYQFGNPLPTPRRPCTISNLPAGRRWSRCCCVTCVSGCRS